MTTLDESAEEYSAYINKHKCCIFHLNGKPMSDAEFQKIKDWKFVELHQFEGNEDDNFIFLYLIESICQSIWHKKVPSGTCGWRYNAAGVPYRGSEKRTCILYFTFSEKEMLQLVESEDLTIKETKTMASNKKPHPFMNYSYWSFKG